MPIGTQIDEIFLKAISFLREVEHLIYKIA